MSVLCDDTQQPTTPDRLAHSQRFGNVKSRKWSHPPPLLSSSPPPTHTIQTPSGSHLFHFPYSAMSVYNHRPMVPTTQSRLIELLDAVRAEFDQLAQEAIMVKNQRDEYELKSKSIQPLYTHMLTLQQHSEQPNTRNESLSTKPYGHGTNATNAKETVRKKRYHYVIIIIHAQWLLIIDMKMKLHDCVNNWNRYIYIY